MSNIETITFNFFNEVVHYNYATPGTEEEPPAKRSRPKCTKECHIPGRGRESPSVATSQSGDRHQALEEGSESAAGSLCTKTVSAS